MDINESIMSSTYVDQVCWSGVHEMVCNGRVMIVCGMIRCVTYQ